MPSNNRTCDVCKRVAEKRKIREASVYTVVSTPMTPVS
jgi:hypothetical protein